MIFVTVYGVAYVPPAATVAYAEFRRIGVGAVSFGRSVSGSPSRMPAYVNGSVAVPASTAPSTASLNGWCA